MTALLDQTERVREVRFDMPDAEYHRRLLGIASKTGLDKIAKSPAHYRAWLEEEQPVTPAMRFGKLFHQYTLEPAKCLETVAVQPDFGDCRLKAIKQARDEWRAENHDKEWITKDDWELCRRMGDAVHAHPIAAALIAKAKAEVAIRWTDAATGLECKSRLDGFIQSLGIILDLKTTEDASPDSFARSCASYRYHVQDAFYRYGCGETLGSVTDFVFIAVEKSSPFAVVTYRLDDAAINAGHVLYRRDLETLKRCVEADEWPAYGLQTQTLSLPNWSLRGIS